MNSIQKSGHPEDTKIIEILHLSIIDTSLRGKSKLNQNWKLLEQPATNQNDSREYTFM